MGGWGLVDIQKWCLRRMSGLPCHCVPWCCWIEGVELQDVLYWLAQQPAVHWLAPKAPVMLHNWQGTAISQSATAAPDAPVLLSNDRGSHPVWAAGLTGQGQIIGAGDSGLGKCGIQTHLSDCHLSSLSPEMCRFVEMAFTFGDLLQCNGLPNSQSCATGK